MGFRFAFLAASAIAAAFPYAAAAQPVTGPYVSLGAGWDFPSSQHLSDLRVDGYLQPQSGRIILDNGWTVEGSIGYGFGDGFRVELEGDTIHNDFSKLKAGGVDYPSNGHEQRYGAFVNALYDFDIGSKRVYPYVGAGIGWQDVDFDNYSPALSHVSKTRAVFAYQGIAGLAFPIAPVPGLAATVEYRFIGFAGWRKYTGTYGCGCQESFKAGPEYDNQILAGLRYQLFQPVPPAPPLSPVSAPVPAPAAIAAPAPVAKTYLIFFDWDKADLTPRAVAVIAQAASSAQTANITTIDVSGYTDTSGGFGYNMALSERRAKAVEGQLAADGVPPAEIELHAYGETHLLVQTGPGVREPQNRRVEIVFR